MELTTVYLEDKLLLVVNSHIIGTALSKFTPEMIKEIVNGNYSDSVTVESVDLPVIEVSRPPLVPDSPPKKVSISKTSSSAKKAAPKKGRKLPNEGTLRRNVLDAVMGICLLDDEATLKAVMQWMGCDLSNCSISEHPHYAKISSHLSALHNHEKLLLRTQVDNPDYHGGYGHPRVYSYQPSYKTLDLYQKAGIGRLP